MKIVAIIPVHLASVRLKQKALLKIQNHPMVIHVYKRVLLSKNFTDVFVATGDEEIITVLKQYDVQYIKTYKDHTSGTLRCAEAILNIDCDAVCVVQGDEPLIDPLELDYFCTQVKINYDSDTWNAVCEVQNKRDLTDLDIVKCVINRDNIIQYMFRKDHFLEFKPAVFKYTKKIMGLFAYRKKVLQEITENPVSLIAKDQNIEQLNIIDNGFTLTAIPMKVPTQSVNTPSEAKLVVEIMKQDEQQKLLLKQSFERRK